MMKSKVNQRQARILLILSAFILQIALGQQISYDPSAISASNQIQIVKDPSAINTKFYSTPSTIHELLYDSSSKKSTFKVIGFDPSQASFQKVLSSSQFADEWTFTASRNDSCTLAKSATNFAFLSFNRSSQAASFKNFTATANLLSKSADTLTANILCSAIQFRENSSSTIYSLNPAGSFSENSFTGATVLSDDFDYVWEQTSKTIKVFNRNTNKYDVFLTLNSTFSSVRLFSNIKTFIFLGLNTVYNQTNASSIDSTNIEVRVYQRGNNSPIKSLSFSTFGNQLIYSATEDLSKIIIFYKDKTQKIVLIGNSFNFQDKKSYDIVFKDQSHISTILSAGVGRYSLTLGNNIFLLTSATLQQAYLLNGLNANFFKSMNIPASYQGSYGLYLIDGKNMPSLRVFLISKPSADGFTVVYFDYGQVIPKAPESITPYLSLQVPRIFQEQFTSKDMLFWGYSHFTVSPPKTNFTMIAYSPLLPNKYANVTQQINLVWNVMAMNTNCGAFKNLQYGQFRILLFNHLTNTETQIDITALILSSNPTPSSVFAISEDCLSFRFDKYIFKLKLDTRDAYQAITNNPFDDWASIDQDINFVFRNNQQIWKYDSSTNAFALYYTLNGTFTNPILSSYKDRVVVASRLDNTSSIQISAVYKPTNNSTTLFFQKSIGGFSAPPQVEFSPNVTKVVIYGFEAGDSNQTNPKTVILYMDYNKAQGGQVKIDDFISKYNAKRDFEYVEDNYIYLRQLKPSTPGDYQVLYYFSKDRKAYRILKRSLSVNEESQWKNTVLQYGATTEDILIFSVLYSDYHLNIYKQQASSKLLEQQQQQNGFSFTIIDGKIVKCALGCSDCSTGVCTSCFEGFAFDDASKSCLPCNSANRCAACNYATPNICTKCFPGTFLSNSSCTPCDKTCFQCVNSTTNCISCIFGKYFVGGECLSCPENCAVCSNSSTCTQCAKGTVLVGAVCRKCSIQCSSCNPSNITQCTDCIDGMRLLDSSCVSCPTNCLSCDSSNLCTKCKGGYKLGSTGNCVQQCSSTCLNCQQKQQQQCTQCYPGTKLLNGKCVLDYTCNNNNTCTDCGMALNYYLNQFGKCIECPQNSDCLQCQPAPNTGECSICKKGRYVSADSTCSKCPKNCSSCISETVCTSCASGYTFTLAQTIGSCQPCTGGCLQCLGETTYCLTCKDKFTKKGVICESNNKVSFKITLNTASSTLLNDIDAFQTNFINALSNGNAQLKKNLKVNFYSIKQGSTIVEGSVISSTQNQQNLQAANQNFQNQVSSGSSIGAYPITASSSSINDADNDRNDDSKAGLIIGLVIGIAVLIVVIIVVIVKLKKKSNDELKVEEKDEPRARSESNNNQIQLVSKDGSQGKLEDYLEERRK